MKRLLVSVVAAVLALVAITTANAYLLGSDNPNDLDGLRYTGRWWTHAASPYPITDHVVTWCWDSRNNSNSYGTVARSWVEDAADAWSTEADVFEFVDGGNCSPSTTTCSGATTDGVNRIYFDNSLGSGTNGQTCSVWDDESQGATGQMQEADVRINIDAADISQSGSCTSATYCPGVLYNKTFFEVYARLAIAHELGHIVGLAHSCTTLALMCDDGGNNDCEGRFVNSGGTLPYCEPQPQSDDMAGLNAIYQDNDNDGCTALEESSPNEGYGGGYNQGVHRADTNHDMQTYWASGRKRDFGDVDASHAVNGVDEAIVKSYFGDNVVAVGGIAPNRQDQNGDSVGSVNALDVAIVKSQFGNTCLVGP